MKDDYKVVYVDQKELRDRERKETVQTFVGATVIVLVTFWLMYQFLHTLY